MEFAESGLDKVRREPVQSDEKQEHDKPAENESGDG